MILGIDASNIRGGGGVTHLVELLGAASPNVFGFSKVVVWAPTQTLNVVPDRPWLVKRASPWLERPLPWRVAWHVFRLSAELRRWGCDVLFAPGANPYLGDVPVVSMSQNLLPFDWKEIRRFGISAFLLKLLLIRWRQSASFRQADGVIFLTRHAMDQVTESMNFVPLQSAIIPHGIDRRFQMEPRRQRPIAECNAERPFSLLYVSHIWPYKHPWVVAEAVAMLRARGLSVALDVVGGGYGPSIHRLHDTIRRLDPDGEFLHHVDAEPYESLHRRYHAADTFVFASSCETFGQIVTEAMSAGLPIVCSERAAMPELLGDAGQYFNPENKAELVEVLHRVIASPVLRTTMGVSAHQLANSYSWKRCADSTFAFLGSIAKARSAAK